MADIFISYARADRDRIEKLAAALETQGYSVWWDKRIQSGAEFSKDIEAELAAAKAVVVCWSKSANDSRWVKDEANAGAEAGKLMTLTIDGELPPLGFRQFHCADLSGWKGKADDAAFADFNAAVKARVTGEAPPAVVFDRDGAERKPVRVLAVAAAAALIAVFAGYFLIRGGPEESTPEAAAVTASEKSIAVLPFVALSDDASDDYFGKGVAEELLNALARFPELKVAARTSAFSFEGKDTDIRDIARQLGVAHVLEGSVRRSGDQIRVTAQLIRASDGFHLWSNTYEKQTADIFAIEDEIVRDIARTLEIRLGVGGGTGRASGEGVDAQAYEEYLKGLTLWGERDRAPDNRLNALKAFQNATGFDPEFADAWAALGFAGAFSAGSPLGIDAEEMYQMTTEAFDRALDLDPNNAVAHSGLVYLRATQDIDIQSARAHLDRALTLAPNRADSHYAAALYWRMVGDAEQTVTAYNRAVALDPLNMTMQRLRAQFLVQVGRVDEAFEFFDACRASECLKGGFPVYAISSAIQSRDNKRMAEWLPVFESFEAMLKKAPPPRPPAEKVFPAYVSVALDRPDKQTQIENMKKLFEETVVTDAPGMWAPILSEALSAEVIIENLHQAYDRRSLFATPSSFSPYYGVNPYPEEILRHPRYHELWARPGMAELAAARRANGWEDGLPLPTAGDAE